MFQNSFLTRIPYSSQLQQGKKTSELILPSDHISQFIWNFLMVINLILAYLGQLFFIFLLLSLGFYLHYLSLIISGSHISPHKGVHQGLFQSKVSINKGITKHVRVRNFQSNKLLLAHLLCVGGIISLPWFSKQLKNDLSKNN